MSENVQCRRCNQAFTLRPEDDIFYERFDVPRPKDCPDCRLRSRLLFRNERTLYRRPSSLSGKPTISIYAPESPYVVYSPQEWWADSWDGERYARPIDFSRPFFPQLAELRLQVPRIALFNVNPENSDYCQQAYDNRNCYLCMVVKDCQDSMYVTHSNKLRDCFDCSHLQNSELCYDCIDSDRLYACFGCQSCQNSSDLYFCEDCIGCHYCIGCSGLRGKSYYVSNQQVSREEFESKRAALRLDEQGAYQHSQETFQAEMMARPRRENHNLSTENCRGDFLVGAKDSYECFDAFQIQSCAYSTWIFESNNCYDIYGMGTSEWVYASVGVEKLTFAAFNTFVSHSNDAFYSDLCFHCRDIFGCVGLRTKQYAILNKVYSADEYREVRARLILHMRDTGEWGEFLPQELSPFAYNETVALDYFPITSQEAVAAGYRWRPADRRDYKPQLCKLPRTIREVPEASTQEVLACTQCAKNFRFMAQELRFYQQYGIYPPSTCTDCRYLARTWRRNPRQLWPRSCGECAQAIVTTYAPARPERILCEPCYQRAAD